MYDDILRHHFATARQMVFLSGPRQVGKTTLSRGVSELYMNWDRKSDRELILRGEDAVADKFGLSVRRETKPVAVFDEIHHYSKWKQFLKGYFDTYGEDVSTLVTGSARLDIQKRGRKGDSLMGRYFPFRMHPLSVGELLHPTLRGSETVAPGKLGEAEWRALWDFGGFPEPFVMRSSEFSTRWRRLRREQLVRIDIMNDTNIRDLDLLDALASLLANRSGEQVVYSSIAKDIQVNEITVREWISTLNSYFFGFYVRPYFRNVENSIRKTPKWYLRDWSGVRDRGKRCETFMACHLLKAVQTWTDMGLGDYELHYLRNKSKQEVDFLVTKDGSPMLLIEAKETETNLNPALALMQRQTGAPVALQVVANLPYQEIDCFAPCKPCCVPMRTFLSQLP